MTVENEIHRLRAANFGRTMRLIRENARLREEVRRMQREIDRLEAPNAAVMPDWRQPRDE